jgi:predicted SAM-dependent methyltransferase/glycosyltransferase involved in cell wall biosynthesis
MPERHLNLGCGLRLLPGFVNVVRKDPAEIAEPGRDGLPFADDSVAAIYSDGFLERLDKADALAALRECRRVLEPGGTLRIATPDLDTLLRRALSDDWRRGRGASAGEPEWIDNGCELLNLAMRQEGCAWLYSETELRSVARLAGLEVRARCRPGESAVPVLRGLEPVDATSLVLELGRPAPRPPDGPLVSVLIAAYRPEFFGAALSSALEQSYRNLEILIGDDSGGDEIERTCRERAGADPRVRYERNPARLFGRANYIRCLARARGEYVKFLNDDDLLAPDCVARLLAGFAADPTVRLAVSKRTLIDGTGAVLADEMYSRPIVEEDGVVDGATLADLVLRAGINVIGEPTTALFRRADALAIQPDFLSFGGQTAVGIGDVALWLNLLAAGNAAYFVEPLSSFRIHAAQAQRDERVREAGLASWERVKFHGSRLGLLRKQPTLMLRTRPFALLDWESRSYGRIFPELFRPAGFMAEEWAEGARRDDAAAWRRAREEEAAAAGAGVRAAALD